MCAPWKINVALSRVLGILWKFLIISHEREQFSNQSRSNWYTESVSASSDTFAEVACHPSLLNSCFSYCSFVSEDVKRDWSLETAVTRPLVSSSHSDLAQKTPKLTSSSVPRQLCNASAPLHNEHKVQTAFLKISNITSHHLMWLWRLHMWPSKTAIADIRACGQLKLPA